MTKSNRFSNLKTITWILKIKRTFRAKVGKKCTLHFSAFLGDKNVHVTIKPLLYVGLSYKITMKFLNIGQSEKHCGFLLLKNVCYCRMSRCWLQHAGLPDVPFKPHAMFVSCLRNCVTPTQGAAPLGRTTFEADEYLTQMLGTNENLRSVLEMKINKKRNAVAETGASRSLPSGQSAFRRWFKASTSSVIWMSCD